jgi:RecA/RadA recombinase
MQKKKEKKADKTMGGEDATVLNDTLKAIQTKFGEGAIMKFGDSPKVDINVIPTGSIGLDMALGIGGIPRGRIIEIFGPESSGKTTLSLAHRCRSAESKAVFAHTSMRNTQWTRTTPKNLE